MDKKILFIEDDFLIGDLYKRQLLLAGYLVTMVRSGEEAIALTEKETFDILLCDLSLPGMSGIDVLEQFKKQGKQVPFVIFSNMAQESYTQKAKELGATDYWIKDQLLPAQLVERVANLLQPQGN